MSCLRFGDRTRFSLESDTMLGVTRSFRSCSSAREDVKDARIFAGIHFRKATEDGPRLRRVTSLRATGYNFSDSGG